jgi:hypothetical protein
VYFLTLIALYLTLGRTDEKTHAVLYALMTAGWFVVSWWMRPFNYARLSVLQSVLNVIVLWFALLHLFATLVPD